MIDEIDAIGIRRGQDQLGEMSRIVIGLMQNLDNLSPNVTLIAATNRRDQLDEALLRRFSLQHKVERLSENERRKMTEKFLRSVDFPYKESWLNDFVSVDRTQAEIRNELVMMIVNDMASKM